MSMSRSVISLTSLLSRCSVSGAAHTPGASSSTSSFLQASCGVSLMPWLRPGAAHMSTESAPSSQPKLPRHWSPEAAVKRTIRSLPPTVPRRSLRQLWHGKKILSGNKVSDSGNRYVFSLVPHSLSLSLSLSESPSNNNVHHCVIQFNVFSEANRVN